MRNGKKLPAILVILLLALFAASCTKVPEAGDGMAGTKEAATPAEPAALKVYDEAETASEDHVPPRVPQVNTGLTVIGENADSYFRQLKADGLDYYPYGINFFSFGSEVFDLPLDGTEENFHIANHIIVTVRNNTIVGYSQGGIQGTTVKTVKELLRWLGSGYETLLEHPPEIIPGPKNIVTYLKWTTDKAVFVVSSLEGDDPADWKDYQAFNFCVFESSN